MFTSPEKKDISIPFAKMEGCGNDYVFIDTRSEGLGAVFKGSFSKEEIQRISDRNRGIGSDGLVILSSPEKGEGELCMRMWNSDGSHSDMCGNALRCAALWEYKRTGQRSFKIQSARALHTARIGKIEERGSSASFSEGVEIEIEMPSPFFDAQEIPFALRQGKQIDEEKPIHASLYLSTERFPPQEIYTLSMGNPHCIIFLEKDADLGSFPARSLGKLLENHPSFPEGSNVEFAVQREEGLFLRTYERGSGETLACGSGACAAHCAAVLRKGAPARQRVFLRGGELEIEWQGDTEKKEGVFMRGPARFVYTGSFLRSTFRF